MHCVFYSLCYHCIHTFVVLHLGSSDQSKDYFEAMELEPGLVEQETPKIGFLRTDNLNPQAAANRLAFYWKLRRELFFDRWLLPMNQTGKGALTSEEVGLIRSGYVVMTVDPVHGDFFCVVDHAKMPMWEALSAKRLTFYWNVVFGHENAQTKGLRCLYVTSSAPMPQISVDHRAWPMMMKAFNCKLKRITVAKTHEEGRQPLVDFQNEYLMGLLGQNCGLPIRSPDTGSTQGDLSLMLEDGMSRELIPKCLGGSFDYRQFDDWVRSRLSIEDPMSSAPPILNSSLWGQVAGLSSTPNVEDAAAQGTQQRKLKRQPVEVSQRAAVYSKRYHHRKKKKEIILQDEKAFLRERNNVLKQENDRLVVFLAQARELIKATQQHGMDSKPAARIGKDENADSPIASQG